MWALTGSMEKWRGRAQCRGIDPDIFVHPDGERGAARRRRERMAKQICAGCPVLQQCVQYSIAAAEPFGTWGGITENERFSILVGGEQRDPTAEMGSNYAPPR